MWGATGSKALTFDELIIMLRSVLVGVAKLTNGSAPSMAACEEIAKQAFVDADSGKDGRVTYVVPPVGCNTEGLSSSLVDMVVAWPRPAMLSSRNGYVLARGSGLHFFLVLRKPSIAHPHQVRNSDSAKALLSCFDRRGGLKSSHRLPKRKKQKHGGSSQQRAKASESKTGKRGAGEGAGSGSGAATSVGCVGADAHVHCHGHRARETDPCLRSAASGSTSSKPKVNSKGEAVRRTLRYALGLNCRAVHVLCR